ncbi:MAG: hypothetical protein ABL903_18455 [Methylococcales bacterium]
MNITIEKIPNKAGDKQYIKFVYWYGSHVNHEGKRIHNRKSKRIDQYLYINPTTEFEQHHNIETL